jgi:dinuclear metal center YbgI/SA1388 family protein
MKIKDITDHLESIAPLAYQESYDNAGLITGDKNDEAKGALICLDSTEEVIDEAIEKGCNLVIAHHPIVFSGLKKINGKNYVERVIIKAIRNNIAIYASHTNLDNVHNGVNAKIAAKLGLKNTKVLSPKSRLLKRLIVFCPVEKAEQVRQALFKAGAGTIGEYDECSFNTEGTGTFRGSENTDPYIGKPGVREEAREIKIETIYPAPLEGKVIREMIKAHPYEEVAYDIIPLDNRFDRLGSGMIGELEQEQDEMEFLKHVKSALRSRCVRYTRLLGRKVNRVAVCGGAGSFLLNDAIGAGADVFITADYKYHQFFDAENKLVIADVGHYESEQFTTELFYEVINKKFPTFAVHLSEINTNPINYL